MLKKKRGRASGQCGDSACVYHSCDQPSAPVLRLCSSSPSPSVCTYCLLPVKGALKAVRLRGDGRADVVLWKHKKQVCKSEL